MSWAKLYILAATDPKRVGSETEFVKLNLAMGVGMLFVPTCQMSSLHLVRLWEMIFLPLDQNIVSRALRVETVGAFVLPVGKKHWRQESPRW